MSTIPTPEDERRNICHGGPAHGLCFKLTTASNQERISHDGGVYEHTSDQDENQRTIWIWMAEPLKN